MTTEPIPGTTSTASQLVSASDLASALPLSPTNDFPPVFATVRMIALMEIAAARALSPHLAPGQLSVGASINATHTAPTPAGLTATAEATYRGREGKMYAFDIVAKDPAREIGRATHLRAVVDVDRLVKAAGKRMPESGVEEKEKRGVL